MKRTTPTSAPRSTVGAPRPGLRSHLHRTPADAGVLRATLLEAVLPAVVLLAIVLAVAVTTDVRLADVLPDPTAVAGVAALTGAVSAVGVLLWAAGAGAALAAAGRGTVEPSLRRALRALGLLTVLLALDDQFLLHEELLPALGVPQPVVLAVLGLLAGLVLHSARNVLLARPDAVVLALAVGLLCASAGVDLVQEWLPADVSAARLLVEDGLKLCGIAVWLRYLVLLARS